MMTNEKKILEAIKIVAETLIEKEEYGQISMGTMLLLKSLAKAKDKKKIGG